MADDDVRFSAQTSNGIYSRIPLLPSGDGGDFVCTASGKHNILFNPNSRHLVELPHNPPLMTTVSCSGLFDFGFGYFPSKNEYKVHRSSLSNISDHYHENDQVRILSFDMRTEKFMILQLQPPVAAVEEDRCDFCVAELQGELWTGDGQKSPEGTLMSLWVFYPLQSLWIKVHYRFERVLATVVPSDMMDKEILWQQIEGDVCCSVTTPNPNLFRPHVGMNIRFSYVGMLMVSPPFQGYLFVPISSQKAPLVPNHVLGRV